MMYCKRCNVNVMGQKERCPLCQNELSGTPDINEEAFPRIEDKKYNKTSLLKIISFAAIITIVCSVGLNMIIPMKNPVWWSAFVVAGVICAWISVSVAIKKRRNIFKNINWQLFLVTVFAIGWDKYTGEHGWSLDYVLPFSCIASMVCMYILSKILKIEPRGFVLYMLFDVVFGVLPAVFLGLGMLNVTYPSIVCVACSIISVSAIIIFEGRNIKDEITRKLHM